MPKKFSQYVNDKDSKVVKLLSDSKDYPVTNSDGITPFKEIGLKLDQALVNLKKMDVKLWKQ